MTQSIRLTFWLCAMDLFHCLGCDRAYLWAVGKASDATDWGEGADRGEGEPF